VVGTAKDEVPAGRGVTYSSDTDGKRDASHHRSDDKTPVGLNAHGFSSEAFAPLAGALVIV